MKFGFSDGLISMLIMCFWVGEVWVFLGFLCVWGNFWGFCVCGVCGVFADEQWLCSGFTVVENKHCGNQIWVYGLKKKKCSNSISEEKIRGKL